jgi:citrate synthase
MEYIPGLAGVPATESAISHIDGQQGQLFYRGYSIEELAKRSTFEETAYLLMMGELPTPKQLRAFKGDLMKHRRIKFTIEKLMKGLPPSAHPMHVLQMAVSSLSCFFPNTDCVEAGGCSEDEMKQIAEIIFSHVATLVAMWEHIRNGYSPIRARDDLSYAENFLWMVTGEDPDPELARIFDICLILHAEHTINASTFTAMVTGSTLANPCAVIAAATASLSGPLHGGANAAVVDMFNEIGHPSKAREYVETRIKNKQVIWGMGHREYKTKDPRAKILQSLVEDLMAKRGNLSIHFEIAKEVEKVCEELLGHKGVYPNVDFYSGILYREMGLRPELFTPIFAVARTAGWLAHLMEQIQQNRIFRPTQIYVGKEKRAYTPSDKR